VSAVLTLAKPEHLEKLIAMVTAFHEEAGINLSDQARRNGVAPLLDGIPHGVAYLVGPPRSPIGYIIVTFGWSLEFGGMDGFIDEFYVRPGVRGRGIASETLQTLPRALGDAGLTALHLEVDMTNDTARRLYTRAGFVARENYQLMTRKF
jgi:ribosomal protein S18 acetylase RimI-like enzyme